MWESPLPPERMEESACWGGWEERHGVRKIYQNECRGDRAAEIISPRSAKIENYVPVTTVESSYVDIVPESTITSVTRRHLSYKHVAITRFLCHLIELDNFFPPGGGLISGFDQKLQIMVFAPTL